METQGECHVMTGAETGTVQLQAGQRRGPAANHEKLGRGRQGVSPAGFRGSVACAHLDFRLLELSELRDHKAWRLKPSLWYSVMEALENG